MDQMPGIGGRTRVEMKKVERVEGFVSDIAVRKTRSGNYDHTITVGGKSYSCFQNFEVATVARGDCVRFTARRKQYRTSRRVYWVIDPPSLEIISAVETAQSHGGFVYVLTNPALPGLVKVGFTTGTPQNRAQELSGATGVPAPFSVAYSLPIHGDPKKVERAAHAVLDPLRYGKEFFRATVPQATEAVQRAYANLYPRNTDPSDDALQKRRKIAQARFEEERERIRKAREHRAFEKTVVGGWTASGEVHFSFGRVTVPKLGKRGWLGELFLTPRADWLRLEVSCYSSRDASISLRIRGLCDGVELNDSATLRESDLRKMFVHIHAYLALYAPPMQWELDVRLPARVFKLECPDEKELRANVLELQRPEHLFLSAGGLLDLTAFSRSTYPFPERECAVVRAKFASLLAARNPRHALIHAIAGTPKTVAPVRAPLPSIASVYGDPDAHRNRLLNAGVSADQIDAMFEGRSAQLRQ